MPLPIIKSKENPEYMTFLAGEKDSQEQRYEDNNNRQGGGIKEEEKNENGGSKSILTLRNTTLKKRQISEKHQALQKKVNFKSKN